MEFFLTAFDDVSDPRASNSRHDLCELLVVAFVAVLCGTTSCAEMAAFGRSKEHVHSPSYGRGFNGCSVLLQGIELHKAGDGASAKSLRGCGLFPLPAGDLSKLG